MAAKLGNRRNVDHSTHQVEDFNRGEENVTTTQAPPAENNTSAAPTTGARTRRPRQKDPNAAFIRYAKNFLTDYCDVPEGDITVRKVPTLVVTYNEEEVTLGSKSDLKAFFARINSKE